MAVDRKGNVLVTGYIQGNLHIGGTNLQAPTGVSTFFLLKLNSRGELTWARQTTDHYLEWLGSYGNGVSVDARGNAYVVGTLMGIVDFGYGIGLTNLSEQEVFFIAKFTREGKPLWAVSSDNERLGFGFPSIATSPLGSIYVTGDGPVSGGGPNPRLGTFVSNYGRNGKLRWNRWSSSLPSFGARHGANTLALDRQGNTYVGGYSSVFPQFGHLKLTSFSESYLGTDMFIWSLNRFGRTRYAALAGSNGCSIGVSSIAVRAVDDVVFTAGYSGDVMIGRTNLSSGDDWASLISRLRRWSY